MDSFRDEYTINPETGRKIKVGTQTWKRLASKYYMIDGKFTDQSIPDSRAYLLNKVFGVKEVVLIIQVTHRRFSDPKGEHKYLIVGSKAWNERFLEYEWNGHEFGDKQGRPLLEFMSTVEKSSSTTRRTLHSTQLGPGPGARRRKWARTPTQAVSAGGGAERERVQPQSRASSLPSGRGRARETFLHPESRQAEREAGALKRASTGCRG